MFHVEDKDVLTAVKKRFFYSSNMPAGVGSLFFIQIFATLGFAVLYSTLVLYMTKRLGFKEEMASTIMGSFIAFNYGLHLLGGLFGGQLLSYRSLFSMGMLLQLLGCLLLSFQTTFSLYWGLGFFLTGAGLNVTCINLMVTQLFPPDDKRRESAFLWNYSGMNVGFLIGFSIAGYFQLKENYHDLFIVTSLGNIITLLLIFFNWGMLKDQHTVLSSLKQTRSVLLRNFLGICLIISMVPSLRWFLMNANFSNHLVVVGGAMVALMLFSLALRQPVDARNKMFAYLVLALASLIFFSLYQLAPMGLTIFAENNINRHVFGVLITPQWIQNINTVVIITGGPLFSMWLKRLRLRGVRVSIPLLFTLGLFCIGLGFVVLPIGIRLADAHGYVNFIWIFLSYIFQSIGELMLSPIGYAMVGQLAPHRLRGMMMGAWMMITGVAGVFSSWLSNMAIAGTDSPDPLLSNPGYSHMFNLIGWVAIAGGIVLTILLPLLRYLINEKPLRHSVT